VNIRNLENLVLGKNKGIIFSKMGADGAITLLHPEDEKNYFRIQGVAALIWKEIDGKKSLKEIVARVQKKAPVPVTNLKPKTIKLVAQLKKENLISVRTK
jgi:coenzyme PQQ synthesis protein D (PqqD)